MMGYDGTVEAKLAHMIAIRITQRIDYHSCHNDSP